jgi:hypothetical protein
LSWDIQRYRALRHKVLELHRQNAIESALRRVDAAVEIDARLASLGFDAAAIELEVIVQAREVFIRFDNLMHSAQNRRIFLLAKSMVAARLRSELGPFTWIKREDLRPLRIALRGSGLLPPPRSELAANVLPGVS